MRYTDKIISFKHTIKSAISLLIVFLNQLVAHTAVKLRFRTKHCYPRLCPTSSLCRMFTNYLPPFLAECFLCVHPDSISPLLSVLGCSNSMSWFLCSDFSLGLAKESTSGRLEGGRRVRLSPMPLSKCSHQQWASSLTKGTAPVRWSSLPAFAYHSSLALLQLWDGN